MIRRSLVVTRLHAPFIGRYQTSGSAHLSLSCLRILGNRILLSIFTSQCLDNSLTARQQRRQVVLRVLSGPVNLLFKVIHRAAHPLMILGCRDVLRIHRLR